MSVKKILRVWYAKIRHGERYEYQCAECKKVFGYHKILLLKTRYLCKKCAIKELKKGIKVLS